VEKVSSTISEAGQRELTARLADLEGRDLTASSAYDGLENPSFEPAESGNPLPGWTLLDDGGDATAELDATTPQDGKTCLYLRNRRPGQMATLESNAFVVPPTGQLVMTVFVRGENVDPSAELRLVFEADRPGAPYRHVAPLGGGRAGAQPLPRDWGAGFAFRSEDLPLDSRGRMRVKFELAGTGEVWIDNVQLYDLLFPLPFYERSAPEKLELVKLIRAADRAQKSGNLADCVQLLEGYWPRFLTAYTPLVERPIAEQPPVQETPAAEMTEKPDDAPSVGRWWQPFVPGILKR
jgi:hypothetical protein